MKNVDPINPSRLIRLVEDNGLMVHPPTGSPAFTPFWFVPLPVSQCCWLSALAELFLSKHQRCLALQLVFECEQHRWLPPMVPMQRCSREGTAWNLSDNDMTALPPSRRIMGSFQSGIAAGLDDIVARIPPHDGIHLFLQMRRRQGFKYWFVRYEGEIASVPPEAVTIDDWVSALAAHRDRFIVE